MYAFLNRLSPYEWDYSEPWKKDSDKIEYDMNLPNCLWHNWGSLMQQGSDISPRYMIPTKYVAMLGINE